jgi:hypothetical protein
MLSFVPFTDFLLKENTEARDASEDIFQYLPVETWYDLGLRSIEKSRDRLPTEAPENKE